MARSLPYLTCVVVLICVYITNVPDIPHVNGMLPDKTNGSIRKNPQSDTC